MRLAHGLMFVLGASTVALGVVMVVVALFGTGAHPRPDAPRRGPISSPTAAYQR